MTNELMNNAGNPPKGTPGWSAERRARQAEWMRTHKPWLKSTGPKTRIGKARAGQNAYRHGFRSKTMRELRRLLRQQHHFVTSLLENSSIPSPTTCLKQAHIQNWTKNRSKHENANGNTNTNHHHRLHRHQG